MMSLVLNAYLRLSTGPKRRMNSGKRVGERQPAALEQICKRECWILGSFAEGEEKKSNENSEFDIFWQQNSIHSIF